MSKGFRDDKIEKRKFEGDSSDDFQDNEETDYSLDDFDTDEKSKDYESDTSDKMPAKKEKEIGEEKEKKHEEKKEYKENKEHKKHAEQKENKTKKEKEVEKEKHHHTNHKKEEKNSKENKEEKHKKHEKENESDDDSYSFYFENETGEEAFYRIKPKTLIISIIAIIAIALIVFGLIKLNNKIKEDRAAKELMEKTRPAKIQLTIISNKLCEECSALEDISAELNSGYNVTEEKIVDYSSAQAKELINKFQIEKIPAMIVDGELERAGAIDGFESKENVLLYTGTQPPYTDAVTGDILGKVSIVMIVDPSCKDCVNLSYGVDEIKSMASIISDQTYSSSSSMGKELISRYNIRKVPAIIMSKDIRAYEFADMLTGVGTYEADGSFVLRNVSPPYYSLDADKIVGLVSMIYITDKSCKDCYNVSEHKEIVSSMGIKLVSENTYDITDTNGIDLRTKYNITQVPTIILSKEASEYTSFKQVWPDVGTQEADGSYILRKASVMGTYKDLVTNQVVEAAVE